MKRQITEKTLDQAVARCARILGAGAARDWMLGKQLAKIKEDALWKLRRDKDGHQRYHGMSAFANSELGVNAVEFGRCLRIYNGFDTAAMLNNTTSRVAYAIANIRNTKTRTTILNTSRGLVSAVALDAIESLPNSALFFPRTKPPIKRAMQLQNLAGFMTDHPKSRLSIHVRADGSFACTFSHGSVANVGHDRVLGRALMRVCGRQYSTWLDVSHHEAWRRKTGRPGRQWRRAAT